MNLKSQGKDIFIHGYSLVKYPELTSIGNHFALDQFSTLGTSGEYGDYIHIAPNCSIIGGKQAKVIMNHFSGLAAGVRIIASSEDYCEGLIGPTIPIEYRNVTISSVILEPFVTVGTNSIIMPGVKLGIGSAVGANSLITQDTEPWTLYVGSPAKPIKKRNKQSILEAAKKLGLGYEF